MNGFARPAYELIQYDKSIENSIMFGFSNFIVCSNSDIARKIAYNSSLNCKCVTFDGDILEPGTLTGGHMKMGQLLIATYRELREVEDKIKEERRKFEGDKTAYVEYKKRYEEYKEKKKDLEAKKTRRQKIKQRITNLTLTMKKRNFEQEIAAIDERI